MDGREPTSDAFLQLCLNGMLATKAAVPFDVFADNVIHHSLRVFSVGEHLVWRPTVIHSKQYPAMAEHHQSKSLLVLAEVF